MGAPLVLPTIPADPPGGSRRWRAGTLTYTAGGLAALFLLLLAGDFAWSMKERSVGPLFALLLKRQEASDLLVGILTGAIPAAISIVLGPLFSVWSDRARTRWGRRIPFLLVPTPFIVAAMLGIGFSPGLGEWLAARTGLGSARGWTIGCFAAFWTVFEVFTIVANAVFSGLVGDVVPRDMIGRFFGLFRAVSLGAGILFNAAIIGQAERHYVPIFIALAAVYGAGFAVMCLRVKEGAYPPPPPRAVRGPAAAIRAYARECGSLAYYRLAFAVLALSALCFQPINVFSIYAARSFGMPIESYGRHTAAAFVVSLALAFPLGWLTDRFHPMRTGAATLALYGAAMLAAYAGVAGPASFGAAWIVHVILSGAWFTTTAGLGILLFPRLSFTQFASAAAICSSVANLAFVPAFGWLLDGTGSDYSYAFLYGALLAFAALLLWLLLYRRFAALGGPQDYQPPEAGGA